MSLSRQQYEALMKPLNASRVANRRQGTSQLSYLEAWDVKAHLIRVFGFGGFSADVLEQSTLHSEQTLKDDGKRGNFVVVAMVRLRLTIHGIGCYGQDVTYTEVATGAGQLPSVADAYDMAFKTAESDALKRAAINLGTQFGLSLYDNGATHDVVKGTLVAPRPEDAAAEAAATGSDTPEDEAIEAAVAALKAGGVEVARQPDEPVAAEEWAPDPTPEPDVVPAPHAADVERIATALRAAATTTPQAARVKALRPLIDEIGHLGAANWTTADGTTLNRVLNQALAGKV